MNDKKHSPFIPFHINIVDVVEMLNAAMLVITGYNIGNSAGWFAITTGAVYAAGKKFVERAEKKMNSPIPTPTQDVEIPALPTA